MRLPVAGHVRLPVPSREPAPQCAHLGRAEDPFTRGAHASDEHRCYAHMQRERIDLGHQKRFCLTSAHGTCPFLLVNAREVKRDWLAETRTWWRNVSPDRQGLTAAQLGQWVGLGVAAIRRAAVLVVAAVRWLARLVLQTWRSVRPQPAPVALASEAELVVVSEVADSEVVVPEVLVSEVVASQTFVSEVLVLEVEPISATAETAPPPLDETPVTTEGPHADAREWFLRAKNAETLDDLVKCLERAHALDPDNDMVSFNLEWAKERRETQKQAAKAAKAAPTPEKPAHAAPYSARKRRNLLVVVAMAVFNLVRTAAALGVLAVGGAVLFSGLPARVRDDLLTHVGSPPTPWLPDLSGLSSLVHVPLAGGYDLGMTVPYAIGFLAMFVGFGLLHREPSLSPRR